MKTDLYQHFGEELALKGFSAATVKTYVRFVRLLSKHYNRPPETITDEELHQYLVHLQRDRKHCRNTMIVTICGLRSFYRVELRRSTESLENLFPAIKSPIRVPKFYSIEEVQRILTVKGLRMKQRTMLVTTYAAGLRAREVCHLKVSDILSSRLQIRVEHGKGQRERYTVLSPKLLNMLRNYWRIYRPRHWLFPNPVDQDKPLCTTSLYYSFRHALVLAGLPNRGGVHSLRHSFATHAFESGVDLPTLQSLLGHRWLMATSVYLHVSRSRLLQAKSPLDLLDFSPPSRGLGPSAYLNNLHNSTNEHWEGESQAEDDGTIEHEHNGISAG